MIHYLQNRKKWKVRLFSTSTCFLMKQCSMGDFYQHLRAFKSNLLHKKGHTNLLSEFNDREEGYSGGTWILHKSHRPKCPKHQHWKRHPGNPSQSPIGWTRSITEELLGVSTMPSRPSLIQWLPGHGLAQCLSSGSAWATGRRSLLRTTEWASMHWNAYLFKEQQWGLLH